MKRKNKDIRKYWIKGYKCSNYRSTVGIRKRGSSLFCVDVPIKPTWSWIENNLIDREWRRAEKNDFTDINLHLGLFESTRFQNRVMKAKLKVDVFLKWADLKIKTIHFWPKASVLLVPLIRIYVFEVLVQEDWR